MGKNCLACVSVWNNYVGLPQSYRERDCLSKNKHPLLPEVIR